MAHPPSTHLVSPSRWESPQLRRIQRDSRKKRIKQETLRNFIWLILQLCSFLIPPKTDDASVWKAIKPSESTNSLTSSPSYQNSPIGNYEFQNYESPQASNSLSNDTLKPFERETATSSPFTFREEDIVYQSSHSPIRTSSLPYFHSVSSPSITEQSGIWLKYPSLSGYSISNENIERCRGWIVQRVVRPFISRIIPFLPHIPYLSSFSGMDFSYLQHLGFDSRYVLAPVADAKEEFFYLNRYLTMESYPSAGEYIMERMVQFSKDNYMSLFSYSEWKLDEHSWNLSLSIPSDSEIVLHVISCFLDEVIARCHGSMRDVSYGRFSKRHIDWSFPSPLVRSNGNTSLLFKLGGWKYRRGAVICFLQRRPPVFALLGQGGKCVPLPLGRLHVFAAIVGLFQLIRDYWDGQLFPVDLSHPYLGIEDWIG